MKRLFWTPTISQLLLFGNLIYVKIIFSWYWCLTLTKGMCNSFRLRLCIRRLAEHTKNDRIRSLWVTQRMLKCIWRDCSFYDHATTPAPPCVTLKFNLHSFPHPNACRHSCRSCEEQSWLFDLLRQCLASWLQLICCPGNDKWSVYFLIQHRRHFCAIATRHLTARSWSAGAAIAAAQLVPINALCVTGTGSQL